ncbi:hypothetical protein M514_00295 [Trichuris suis]|uniref:Uncharacterized protein n=1 Tax=Trichuris suis TaxID=68888 RepID=A0A085MN06_9BILA|nr:hypothetical protein M513_00295 [Trichuris suis]KFD68567.1 hypothetical protein M514_00295 [Trichuris suis]
MPAIIIVAALAFASIVAIWLMKLGGEAQVAAAQEPEAAAVHADKDNKEPSLPVAHEDSGAPPSAHSDATKAGPPKDQTLQSSVQTGVPPDQPLLGQRGQADAFPKPQEPIKPPATTADQTAKVPIGQTTEEGQNRNIEAKPPTGAAAPAETPKQLQMESPKGELPPCGSSQAQTGSSTSLETNLASRDKDVQSKEQSMGKQLQPEQTSGTTLPTAAGQQSSQSPEPSSGSPVQGGEAAFKKSEESNLDKKKFLDDKSTMQTAQTITQNDLVVGEDQKKNVKLVADEKQQQQHLVTAQEKTKDKEAPFSEDKPREKSETAAQTDIATCTAKLDSERAGDASSADKGTTGKITVTQVIRIRDEKTIIADGVATQETESLIEKNELTKEKPFVVNTKMVQTTGQTNLAKPKSYTGSKAESSGKTATMAVDTAKLDTEKVFEEETSKEMRNLVSGEKIPGLEQPNTKSNKPNEAKKVVIAQQVVPSPHKESATGNAVETTATPISEPIEQQPAHVQLTFVKPEETASLISITATVVTDKNNDWMLAEMEEMMKEDIIMQDLQKLGMDNNPAINQPQGDQSMRTAVDTMSESKSSNSQNQK